MLRFLFFASFFFLLFSCSSIEVETNNQNGFWYSWRSGDDLGKIAKAYETDKDLLKELNSIYDESDLAPGIQIWIPFEFKLDDQDFIDPSPQTAEKQITNKRSTFIWPALGRISSKFGPRGRRFHYGVDITRSKGREIKASANGKVIFSGWKSGYGKTLVISHGNQLTSLYAHNKRLYVSKGEQVRQGQSISYMGTTGRSTGIHLHFEIRKKNIPQNPMNYLPKR